MKKIIIVEVLLAVLLGIIIFQWRSPIPMIYNEDEYIAMEVEPSTSPTPPEITLINEKNAKIKTFVSKVDLLVIDRLKYKLKAEIAFEKPLNFRMKAENRLGALESDVGSNNENFWFWTRRMKPPGLYYASHKNLMNTGLKTPFNPLWMMESLGLNEIDTKEAKFVRSGNQLSIKQLKLSTLREPVVKITLVDCEKLRIIGQYLYKEGRVIASSEITEFSFGVPTKIEMIWHEENARMIWHFQNPRINNNIDSGIWIMPTKTPQIEMGSQNI